MDTVQLGLRENWKQFTLLVIINGFVGGMVGLERTVLPQLAETEFQLAAHTAILSFIVVFGITKAIANYVTGLLAERTGRKNLLILGWLFGVPVPFILMYAPDWSWVVAANALLGINQGLAWSSTVVMKIDLVGRRNRGLAMGLNESAGYLAVGVVAFLTGWIATEYGLRPYAFFPGVCFALAGLFGSWFLVRDTASHKELETESTTVPSLSNVFWDTTWRHRMLGSITQAGMVNNLNDGMMWGLLPMLLASRHFDLVQVGQIAAVYPVVWGVGQLLTGRLADSLEKKHMLFWGMLAQGLAIVLMIWADGFREYFFLAILLGAGTATVYPTFLAAIADHTHPRQRAESLGVFRLWRDLGYSVGALMTGIIADLFGISWAVASTGVLTLCSAAIIRVRM